MHKTFLLRPVLLIIFLASCSRATPIPTPLIAPLPSIQAPEKIEAVPCPFDVPESPVITCGKLAVPEDYRNPKGAKIHLMVATIHSTGTNPLKDPVIVQYSDPGSVLLAFMQYYSYSPELAE